MSRCLAALALVLGVACGGTRTDSPVTSSSEEPSGSPATANETSATSSAPIARPVDNELGEDTEAADGEEVATPEPVEGAPAEVPEDPPAAEPTAEEEAAADVEPNI